MNLLDLVLEITQTQFVPTQQTVLTNTYKHVAIHISVLLFYQPKRRTYVQKFDTDYIICILCNSSSVLSLTTWTGWRIRCCLHLLFVRVKSSFETSLDPFT